MIFGLYANLLLCFQAADVVRGTIDKPWDVPWTVETILQVVFFCLTTIIRSRYMQNLSKNSFSKLPQLGFELLIMILICIAPTPVDK